MAYIFFDESKHHTWDFSLGAFAICDSDPTKELNRIFEKNGFTLSQFEFKSSHPMKSNPKLQALRDELRTFIRWNCKVAVCIVSGDKNLGSAALKLLKQALQHEILKGQHHDAFLDEGLFSSSQAASKISTEMSELKNCTFHFEQDSKSIVGIQLADLIAHTCGTMLLDALGKKMKTVKVENSGYDTDVKIDLGFELWAGLRYAFLSTQRTDTGGDFDFAVVDVSPHGLFIDDSAGKKVAAAASKRFGEMYLGCIH